MSTRFFESLETRKLMSASFVNGVLTVTGTELNDVITIWQDNARIRVNDNGRSSAFDLSRVTKVVVKGRAGNDRIVGQPNLTKPLIADGGAGRDTLIGGSGNDRLAGGADDDYLDGAKGADEMHGGGGVDHADYTDRTADLSLSLDDIANDGQAGELDNLGADIESLRAGKGNDRVVGSDADNVLYTNAGADTIYGMGGNDRISTGDSPADTGMDRVFGGEGDDWIRSAYSALIAYGDGGNDRILGSDNADTLYGGLGNDELHANGGNDRIEGSDGDDVIHADGGNDFVRGGVGNDWIYAGSGNDLVWGEAEPGLFSSIGITPRRTNSTARTFGGLFDPRPIQGPIFTGGGGGGGLVVIKPIDPVLVIKVNSDTILGAEGNDTIHGGDGSDRIRGDADNDRLFGDAGADDMFGGSGQDTLVSIGGGIDALFGEADGDNFWKDPSDTTDADLGEILFGGVQEVASFANGASLELDGQNIHDPDGYDLNNPLNPRDDYDPAWKNFASQPLFGPNGIQLDDVRQGGVGDGYLMTALAAIAGKQPFRIKNSIVDLGDGTFAVRFIDADGAHRFYRVDADLPVNPDGTPYYAKLGNGGALWVAIMEKAFALHRGGGNGMYSSLESGPVSEAFAAFGLRAGESPFEPLFSDDTLWNNGTQTMFNIKRDLESGMLVTVQSTPEGIRSGAELLSNRIYFAEQVIMRSFFVGSQWLEKPVQLVLRDTAGHQITLNTDQIEQNLVAADAWQ
jgi:Ca2+-binding RTX toxin-like protein